MNRKVKRRKRKGRSNKKREKEREERKPKREEMIKGNKCNVFLVKSKKNRINQM